MSVSIENVLTAIKTLSATDGKEYEERCLVLEKQQPELLEAVSTLSETGISEEFYGIAFGIVMVIDHAYALENSGEPIAVSAELVNEMVKFQLEDFSKHAADLDAWRDALGSDPERFLYYYVLEMLLEHGWKVELPGAINMIIMLMAVVDAFDEASA